MAIAANGYYNNPAIGQAFSNLSQIFAPPSGAELAGYATAAAKKQEAQRLADLFSYAQTPDNFNKDVFDRMAVATGQGTISNGYYGVDTAAETSRSNNAADNLRALQTQSMSDEAAMARELIKPVMVNEGQTAYLPAATAGATGLAPVLSGQVNAAPGEQITMPDGRIISGAPKPLTETEVIGAILQNQPAADQRSAALASVPVESVIMDGQTVIQPRDRAYGLPPAPSGNTAALKDGTAVINGQQIPVTRAPNDTVWRTADGTPIPANAQVFDMAKPTGTNEQLGLPTVANRSAANNAEAIYNALDADIDNLMGSVRGNPGIAGVVGNVRGMAQNIGSSLSEVIAATGRDISPGAIVALEDVQNAANRISGGRDPAIAQFQIDMANLAYRVAQMNNPTGEVSRQAYERALDSLSGGGMLANNASVGEALTALKAQVQRNREHYLGTLRNPGQTAAPPPAPNVTPATPVIDDLVEKYRTK